MWVKKWCPSRSEIYCTAAFYSNLTKSEWGGGRRHDPSRVYLSFSIRNSVGQRPHASRRKKSQTSQKRHRQYFCVILLLLFYFWPVFAEKAGSPKRDIELHVIFYYLFFLYSQKNAQKLRESSQNNPTGAPRIFYELHKKTKERVTTSNRWSQRLVKAFCRRFSKNYHLGAALKTKNPMIIQLWDGFPLFWYSIFGRSTHSLGEV